VGFVAGTIDSKAEQTTAADSLDPNEMYMMAAQVAPCPGLGN
jgi:hypothetical protein